MAVFTTTATVQRFAGALFGLKLGSTTLQQVQTDLGSNPVANLDSVLNFYYGATFGAASAEDVAARLLANLDIVEGQYGLDADEVAAAEAYVVANLNAAPAGTWGAAVNSILAAFSNLAGDAQFGEVATAWNDKVDAAVAYGASNAGNAAIDAVDPIVTEFRLAIGADDITGSAGNDLFKSNVEQNSAGLQVNTLGSGDVLDGGAGTDTLTAKITTGAFAGGSWSMPIQPETTSIEVVNLEAVWNYIPGEDGNDVDETVFVNAKDMLGVTQLWSLRSDADLVIQNLTSQDNNGNARNLTDMTIGMGYTGNEDSQWDESDYTVYFDQDYLVPVQSSESTAYYFLLDEDADLAGLTNRLDKIDVDGIRFRVDGGDVVTLESAAANTAGTHAAFVAALQEALQAAKDAGLVPADTTLTLDPTITDETFLDDGSESDPIPAIVLNTNSGAAFEPVGFSRIEDEIGEYDVYGRFTNEIETDETLAINVALEKVGLAGDGGQLVIGSMNKTLDNEWDAVNTVTDTTSGIEQFDVTVYGANDKSSSLAGLHSTNNNLRVVNVVTDAAQTGSYADLTIGNSNTKTGYDSEITLSSTPDLDNQYALKDVQTLDASAFLGDLSVYAALTDEITDKYFNLKDEAADAPEDDNVVFDYTGGVGDDYFNIALDTSNDAFAGTVTREDFVMNLTVDGGAGDDVITLAMVNEDGLDDGTILFDEERLENWYDNQKLLNNVRIEGGEGNDTIWTPGSGDVIIDAGVGDDTVYADNTGDKAVWVFNVESADGNANARWDIDNLQSDANNTYRVFKTDVVVNFLGFEAKAAIADTRGVASDLDINQAIKKAINSDPVLSKLLEAKDGPANTLVVTSLIDGSMEVVDLTVSLEGPTAAELSVGDVNSLSSWYSGASGNTPAAASAYLGLQTAVFNLNANDTYNQEFARNNNSDLDGGISIHTSDNTITPDLGNDVIVLGTGVISNDTVVYNGFGNGTDSIVHFDTTWESDTVVTDDPGSVESFTVTFADLTIDDEAVATTLDFDGVTATLSNVGPTQSLIPAEDVAFAFFNAHDGNGTDWIATMVPGTAAITFTAVANGNVTDAVPADFVFANTTAGTPAISGIVQGVDDFAAAQPATAATFDVSFIGSIAVAGTDLPDFDGGGVITVDAGDGPITLAAKVAAATYDNWEAVDNLDGTVTFTNVATGDGVVSPVSADFGGAVDGVVAGITFVDGTDAVAQAGTQTTTVTEEGAALDYLDFSSYTAGDVDVQAIQIVSTAQNEVFGTAPALNGEWIRLTESATVDGRYTVELLRENGATDVVVGVIGVADFGVEQTFVEQNFIY
jgi:hypothetical protein